MGSQQVPHPVAGLDYPRTLQEFDEWFSSENACANYLCRLRWPNGFRCPDGGGSNAWTTTRGQLRCAACQRQTSPTAGTIFDKTRKPLRTFRFNRRRSRARGLLFCRLLQQAVQMDPVTYSQIVGGKRPVNHNT